MNWTDSHRPVDKVVTVGNCRMNRLLFEDELGLHAWIFNRVLNTHLIVFLLCASDQAGTKISSKKIKVLCLLRRPRQCFPQVRGSTLQQVETFK